MSMPGPFFLVSKSRSSPRFRSRGIGAQAFTVMELVISTALSSAIIAALLLSSMSLQRAMNSSRIYADAYSDQHRVTDYIGRDLRRAVGISMTNPDGIRSEVAGAPANVIIADRATLIITLPAYYRSDTRADAEYEKPLDVVADSQRIDYGTSAGIAPPVEVSYRKIFYGKEGSVCFVRQEAGKDEVVVRRAENLSVQVSLAAEGQDGAIKTWFRSPELGPAPLVSTFDRLLLRNPPLNFRP